MRLSAIVKALKRKEFGYVKEGLMTFIKKPSLFIPPIVFFAILSGISYAEQLTGMQDNEIIMISTLALWLIIGAFTTISVVEATKKPKTKVSELFDLSVKKSIPIIKANLLLLIPLVILMLIMTFLMMIEDIIMIVLGTLVGVIMIVYLILISFTAQEILLKKNKGVLDSIIKGMDYASKKFFSVILLFIITMIPLVLIEMILMGLEGFIPQTQDVVWMIIGIIESAIIIVTITSAQTKYFMSEKK